MEMEKSTLTFIKKLLLPTRQKKTWSSPQYLIFNIIPYHYIKSAIFLSLLLFLPHVTEVRTRTEVKQIFLFFVFYILAHKLEKNLLHE